MRCNKHSSNLFSRLHLPSVVVLANCELRAVASSIGAIENDVLSRDRLFNIEDKMSGYFELGVVTNAVLGVQNPSRMYGSFMWRPKRQRYQRSHDDLWSCEYATKESVRLRMGTGGGHT
jgi:hypothetical protein